MLNNQQATSYEKRKATATLVAAVDKGLLERKPCEVCGNPKTHGHHKDYSKPLDVVWLCVLHHMQHHMKKPDDEKQYSRTIAMDAATWVLLGDLAYARRITRSELLRQLIRSEKKGKKS